MCVYCNMGDHMFKYDPPWITPNVLPYIPKPMVPLDQIKPWNIERLKEFERILKETKEMEEKVGCPCEPNKANYIKMFEERIALLEAQLAESKLRERIQAIAAILVEKFGVQTGFLERAFWESIARAAIIANAAIVANDAYWTSET